MRLIVAALLILSIFVSGCAIHTPPWNQSDLQQMGDVGCVPIMVLTGDSK